MQEEEQLRNSVMLNLLYVNRAHDLASHILLYYKVYGQLPTHQRFVSPIDTNARLVNVNVRHSSFMNIRRYLRGSYACFVISVIC
jgi:hypothetical protein